MTFHKLNEEFEDGINEFYCIVAFKPNAIVS